MPIKVTRKKTATVSPFCPILTFNASLIVFAIFVCFDQSLATFFYYLKLRFAAFCCCFSWRVPERVPGPFYCSTGSASVCADTPTPHSMTLPTSTDARRLKSRHPFVPAAQQLISSSDSNNMTTYVWRIGRITNGMRSWAVNPTRHHIFIPEPATIHLERPSQEEPGYNLTTSAPMSGVSAHVCTNGWWLPLGPVSVAQKDKLSTMLSFNVHSLTSSWTAWPDGSGW